MSDEGAREYKQLPPSLSEAEERRFRQAVLVNKANQVELSDAEVLELARKALRSERADDCDLVYDAVAFSLKARGKYGEGLRRLMERVVGENWGDIRADIVEEGGGRWKGKNSPTAVLVEQMRASGNEAFVGKGIEVLSEGGEGVAKRIVGERKFDREHEERWEWILREAIKKSEKGVIMGNGTRRGVDFFVAFAKDEKTHIPSIGLWSSEASMSISRLHVDENQPLLKTIFLHLLYQ
jgi:hypothetical protein